MAFEKLEKKRKGGFTSSVDFPAIIINTGKINSLLNNHFVRELDLKVGDEVAYDILFDEEEKKFAVKVNEDGDFVTHVTKANQITAWLGTFFVAHKIYLKGYKKSGERGSGEKFVCELTKKKDLWIFEIPEKYWLDGPREDEGEGEEKPKKKKKKKLLKKK